MKGSMISVQPIKTKEEMIDESSRTAFISGLKDSFGLSILQSHVASIASVESMFPLFRMDGSFTGKVTVVFHTTAERDMAVSELNNTPFGTTTITAEPYNSRYADNQQRNCFVRSIPKSWKVEDFKAYCARFGEVQSCIIRAYDAKEQLKTGCVCFVSKEAFTKAIEIGKDDPENPDHLVFEAYLTPNERKKIKKQNHMQKIHDYEQACEEKRVVIVHGLGKTQTKEWIKEKLKDYGTILSIHQVDDKNKHSL